MPPSAGVGYELSLPVATPWPRAGLHKRRRPYARRSKGRYGSDASEEGGGNTGTPTAREEPGVASFATKHLTSPLLSPLHAACNTRMYARHPLGHLSRLAYKCLFSSNLHFHLSPPLPLYNLDTYLYFKSIALRSHLHLIYCRPSP